MQPFRRLKLWQKPTNYPSRVTTPPSGARVGGSAPGLRSQLLRAVDAISNNIAEGAGQQSQRQFVKYLEIAISSAHEVDSQLEVARAIGVLDPREARKLQELTWEVKRMLTAFPRAVKRRADGDDKDRRDRG